MGFWRRFVSRRRNWPGIALALMFAFVAVAAPVISPQDTKNPGAFKVVGRFSDRIPRPPGANEKAPLGTIPGQFDVFHTLIWGVRDAMRFGLLVALGAFVFGVLIGAIAGYAGGMANNLVMRMADAFLAFPPLVGAVLLQQMAGSAIMALGGQYWFNPGVQGTVLYFDGELPALAVLIDRIDPLLISLVLFSWVPYARLVNTLVITLKHSEFVEAARALGGSPFWVVRRHLLPNSVSPAIVLGARDVGSSVMLQATMVVLGLGGESPWGTLLAIGRNWITGGVLGFWWVYVPVTLAMILFGITWNLVGDGLSEALSPATAPEADEFPQPSRRAAYRTRRSSAARPAPRMRAQRWMGAPRMNLRVLGMNASQVAFLAGLVAIELCVVIGLALVGFFNP